MRPTWLLVCALLAAAIFSWSCGTNSLTTPGQCPTCGTTKNGAYGIINIIPVPEHNPTGEPGGPFNSFDISVVDSVHHRFYVSDRIGLDIPIFDTIQNKAIGTITGANGVAGAGDFPAVCDPSIPPIISALGNFTRYGCRNMPFSIPGFGPNGLFGGFPGAQCCAARANGVNPLSGPDGEVLSPDGSVLFAANGSSSLVAFDLTCGGRPGTGPGISCTLSNPPSVLAAFPTGSSPDYDGCVIGQTCPTGSTLNPSGINPCIASANGRAFSDPTCGDLRADEMTIGVTGGRTIVLVANGDPGFPFVTLIDATGIINHTDHCLPPAASATSPYQPAIPGSAFPGGNFPTCILGQIYYDGAGNNVVNTAVDNGFGFPCPDPSTPAPSGVSGIDPVSGIRANNNATCHHGPILNPNGTFCSNQAAPTNAACPGFFGAVALAGLGGSAFNPNTGHFLVTNGNASPTDLTVGTVDEIDPRLGNPNGPVVVNSFPMPNCMPTSIVQGPGNNFLVGCADHDGESFPVNEYVIDGKTGKILATIDQVGGVDEIWYNPGDNRYYVAARDMPNGPKLGVIDAGRNLWLVNVTTNSNSHSVSVDSTTNHIFVPLQSGGICGSQSSNGCIGVYAQQ